MEITKEEFLSRIRKDDLYRQSNIIRYNSVDTIRRQNLAEHHGIVAQLTVKIIEELKENGYDIPDRTKYIALAAGSIHDLGEIIFSDINYELKRDNPDLSEISNRIEHEYICSLRGYKNVFMEAQDDKVARAIYKMADALDLMLFVRREHKLGNDDPYLDTIARNGELLSTKCLTDLLSLLDGNK